MSNRTQKNPNTAEATFGYVDDPDTGLTSTASDSTSLIAGGVRALIATATTLQFNAGSQSLNGAALSSVNRMAKLEVKALAAATAILSWQNPESVAVLAAIAVDITTATSGACTADFGGTSASSSTSSDTLMDGLDLNATAAVHSSLLVADRGTNGIALVRVPAGKWITGTVASGTVTGLVGKAIIGYIPLA